MNLKQIGVGIVLLALAALDALAVEQYGYIGLFRLATSSFGTIVLTTDMVIALTLVAIWMGRDANERGVSAIPYLILTLALGSIGPLLYLLVRLGSESPATRPAVALQH